MAPRLEGLLLLSIADVSALSLDMSHEAIRIDVCSTSAGAARPDCGSESTRVHSSYLRFPADVPSGGRLVVLQLRVRRFFCAEPSCARRTFAEQMPGLTRRHRRWTERLRATLAAVGLALAGRAAPGWPRHSGCPSAAARCCGCPTHCPNPRSRPRGWWVSMSTPHAKTGPRHGARRRRDSSAGGSAA
ncbi:transposase family protein [Streptomyces sp. NK15101]|uniref:transposase family protein n=1 Tax=Streptomyces sp. NK15101 TaxID=2873261 RepID=UPI0035A99D87